MTAKEKAIELYNKFRNKFPVLSANIRAKKCALICVDEIINDYSSYRVKSWLSLNGAISLKEYWEEVKQEIEKL